MKLFKLTNIFGLSLLAIGCGGGGGGGTGGGGGNPTPPVTQTPTVTVSVVESQAVEKDGAAASFKVDRTSSTDAISVGYSIASGDANTTYASASDYAMVYSDGSAVGSTIDFAANQASRTIEIRPTADQQHEVIEKLVIDLTSQTGYQLGTSKQATIEIVEADNSHDNGQIFSGDFTPAGNATTAATGKLSLLLQGDNQEAVLSYHFAGLSSSQTNQHIHYAPTGAMVKGIESSSGVTGFVWDMAPSGPFTTRQEVLDALFAGELYVNVHTADNPSGEIRATLQYKANEAPPAQLALTAAEVDQDIVRFLNQATFGATPDSYTALKSQISDSGDNRLQIYETWIDQQMALPATSMLELTDAINQHFVEEDGWHARRDSFWPIALYGKDQLRQRTAYALSQIVVIGDQLTNIRKAYRGTAGYWDMLGSHAFGQYNQLLHDASVHPIMGIWLSHLKNAKADPNQGIFPDENYAREIMQLFSFGLVHLNADGTPKLDGNNQPIPTYDNETIKALARVFTGLSFSKMDNNGSGTMLDNNYFLRGNATNNSQYRWLEPMKFFTNFHDFDEKTLFHDGIRTVTVPAADVSVDNANAEIINVVNAIVAHPSTAPFIARRLIQRFVTSNPSPEYILRVSTAFGLTGDLAQTVKAILLDPEARNPQFASNSQQFGKAKEPVLQLSGMMRLLKAYSPIDLGAEGINYAKVAEFDADATVLRLGDLPVGQYSLGSDSVFNFYLPDFAPSGEIGSQGLVAPELQIMNESQLVTTMNTFNRLIDDGVYRNSSVRNSDYTQSQVRVNLNYQSLESLYQSTSGTDQQKAQAVVDHLDFYMNAGRLKNADSTRSYDAIVTALLAESNTTNAMKTATYGVINAPESLVQQ